MKKPRMLLVLPLAVALACTAGTLPPSPEVVTLPEIDFPFVLLHHGVTTGEVHVLVKISPDGRLLDSLVTAYTHKPFADATLAALPRSTFRPLLMDGQPVITLTEVVVRFEATGLIVVERFASDSADCSPGTFAYQPCDPGRLDRPLQPLVTRSPDYPRELDRQGVRGAVVLEYYIDETGRVRMPRVREAAHDILGGLCLTAIEQWQFSPPLSRNKPVLVRVRQRFEFAPPAGS